jgi:hypothetical protein
MFNRMVRQCGDAMCLTQDSLTRLEGHPKHEAIIKNRELLGDLPVVLAEVEIGGHKLLANVKTGTLYNPDTRKSLSGLSTIVSMGAEIKRGHRPRDKTAQRAAEMLAAFRAGMTSRKEIAAKFGCSYMTVCQNLKLAEKLEEAAHAERKGNEQHA